ncbi:MAG: potassium transporter Kup [Acidobacteriota bacterium]
MGTVTESDALKGRGKRLFFLSLAALGVVYGDIGTSPLYTLRVCFGPELGLPVTEANVLGVLSLVTWALLFTISLKYLVFILKADNRGEGGILALMALAKPEASPSRTRALFLTAMGVFGAALLYGDGIITPAITVLGAMEGLEVVTPALAAYVVPLSLGVLVALFVLQKRGTARVGTLFGPVMTVWFLTLALLGAGAILTQPRVLLAFNPLYGMEFFARNGFHGFLILGAVFLAITGGEALYADMGHFGRRPIRLVWFLLVQPSLMLNYFGQGALLLTDPESARNPFFLLAPSWALYPLVALSTAAAVIASQAVISGAFSLTRQAVQLGFCPRMEIRHTSSLEIGQIYAPGVNWALMVSTILLVLGFQNSNRLAAAYGVAVTTTMVITTLIFLVVTVRRWNWPPLAAVPLSLAFLTVDLAFFGANIIKVQHGGYVPLLLAGAIFVLMFTWKKGRGILAQRLKEGALPADLFLDDVERNPPHRVPGTAVFMTGNPAGIPGALLHNLKHNHVLHERVALLTVTTEEVPVVSAKDRLTVEPLGHGFFRLSARYGFMETPDISQLLALAEGQGFPCDPMTTTFFLGRENLIPTDKPGMARWRKSLFGLMSRNAQSATMFFGIPANRVVELGAQIEL